MLQFLKRLFRPRTLSEIQLEELEDARRQLLTAQTALEYATAMVTYHNCRAARLEAAILASTQTAEK